MKTFARHIFAIFIIILCFAVAFAEGLGRCE